MKAILIARVSTEEQREAGLNFHSSRKVLALANKRKAKTPPKRRAWARLMSEAQEIKLPGIIKVFGCTTGVYN
jgi:hypothetical protein